MSDTPQPSLHETMKEDLAAARRVVLALWGYDELNEWNAKVNAAIVAKEPNNARFIFADLPHGNGRRGYVRRLEEDE